MATIGTSVASEGGSHYMQACNHKEGDARILIHLQDALNNGATTCLVHTVDIDVWYHSQRQHRTRLLSNESILACSILLALCICRSLKCSIGKCSSIALEFLCF